MERKRKRKLRLNVETDRKLRRKSGGLGVKTWVKSMVRKRAKRGIMLQGVQEHFRLR